MVGGRRHGPIVNHSTSTRTDMVFVVIRMRTQNYGRLVFKSQLSHGRLRWDS